MPVCSSVAVYDHAHDDNISWACGRPAYSMKRSFALATNNVRNILTRSKTAADDGKVFLLNAYGYAMLSYMGPFDGIFSEGTFDALLQSEQCLAVIRRFLPKHTHACIALSL